MNLESRVFPSALLGNDVKSAGDLRPLRRCMTVDYLSFFGFGTSIGVLGSLPHSAQLAW
jgi:hypothetical protein